MLAFEVGLNTDTFLSVAALALAVFAILGIKDKLRKMAVDRWGDEAGLIYDLALEAVNKVYLDFVQKQKKKNDGALHPDDAEEARDRALNILKEKIKDEKLPVPSTDSLLLQIQQAVKELKS